MNKETTKLTERKWPSLSTLKNYFEKENINIVAFDGLSLKTKKYTYTLVSPHLYMEKNK